MDPKIILSIFFGLREYKILNPESQFHLMTGNESSGGEDSLEYGKAEGRSSKSEDIIFETKYSEHFFAESLSKNFNSYLETGFSVRT